MCIYRIKVSHLDVIKNGNMRANVVAQVRPASTLLCAYHRTSNFWIDLRGKTSVYTGSKALNDPLVVQTKI